MIQHRFIQIFHKLCIIVPIPDFSCDMMQDSGGIQSLCQSPVHPVMDNRSPFPVCGIDDSRSSVCVPAVFHCPVKEILCRFNIFCSSFGVFFIGGQSPLGNQSCPLDPMSRSGSIRFKLVCRLILITFQVRNPVFCKVFRDPPLILGSPGNYMSNDPSGPFPVLLFSQGVCSSQKSFYCMHVGIYSPVIIQDSKLRIPGIAGKPLFLVPEPEVIKL